MCDVFISGAGACSQQGDLCCYVEPLSVSLKLKPKVTAVCCTVVSNAKFLHEFHKLGADIDCRVWYC